MTELETLLRNILDAEAELSQARENWNGCQQASLATTRALAHKLTVAAQGFRTAINDAREFLGRKAGE